MEKSPLSDEILSEVERSKVIAFAQDTLLFEAVKKYVLAVVYKHGLLEKGKDYQTNKNWALQLAWGASDGSGMPRSDEELGQDIRALTKATQLVGSGFKEISEMKAVETLPENNPNPAE